MVRTALTANNVLHWISSIIVMSIAAYFISKYRHNTHLVYWVTIAAIDAILYLAAMVLPSMSSYKGYLSPLHLIFSYLWLTAFIFSSQDYNFDNACYARSPFGGSCTVKKTLEAFAFLAFITSLIGHLLDWKLHDNQRVKGIHRGGMAGDKMARPSGDTAHTAV